MNHGAGLLMWFWCLFLISLKRIFLEAKYLRCVIFAQFVINKLLSSYIFLAVSHCFCKNVTLTLTYKQDNFSHLGYQGRCNLRGQGGTVSWPCLHLLKSLNNICCSAAALMRGGTCLGFPRRIQSDLAQLKTCFSLLEQMLFILRDAIKKRKLQDISRTDITTGTEHGYRVKDSAQSNDDK